MVSASAAFLMVLRDPGGSGGTPVALLKQLIPFPPSSLPGKHLRDSGNKCHVLVDLSLSGHVLDFQQLF